MIYPYDYGKYHRPNLIVDDWGDINLLINEGKKVEELLLQDGTITDPISTYNICFKIVQTIINHQLEVRETDKWNKIVNTCMGIYDKNTTVFHNLYTM